MDPGSPLLFWQSHAVANRLALLPIVLPDPGAGCTAARREWRHACKWKILVRFHLSASPLVHRMGNAGQLPLERETSRRGSGFLGRYSMSGAKAGSQHRSPADMNSVGSTSIGARSRRQSPAAESSAGSPRAGPRSTGRTAPPPLSPTAKRIAWTPALLWSALQSDDKRRVAATLGCGLSNVYARLQRFRSTSPGGSGQRHVVDRDVHRLMVTMLDGARLSSRSASAKGLLERTPEPETARHFKADDSYDADAEALGWAPFFLSVSAVCCGFFGVGAPTAAATGRSGTS